MKYASFPKATRITVVSEQGLAMEDYNAFEHGAEVHIQDAGRTIKVVPTGEHVPHPEGPFQDGDLLAWKTGGLLGTFMRTGIDAKPILDEDGNYVNRIRVDLGKPFGEVTVVVLREDEE